MRANRLFVAADRCFAWLDGLLARWLPADLNPLAQSARVANFALVVAVLSGVLLLLWYSPGGQTSHPSVLATEQSFIGSWVRAMHRYSSDLAILMILIHALRIFVARKFTGARWLPWVSGILLAGLIWIIGWTGHWLVWDQAAQYVAVTSARILDPIPIFGEPLSRLFASNESVPGLVFFVVFFLHMLLPLLAGVGLAIHVSRLSHFRLLPSRTLAAALLAALTIAALIVPSPLGPAADLTLKPEVITIDGWYLAPLTVAMRLQSTGLLLTVLLTTIICLAVPWIFGKRSAASTGSVSAIPSKFRQPLVDEQRCHACTQCYQDCPYDAIEMLPRTDHPRFNSVAWVNPDRCMSCFACIGSCDSTAMSLPWFDTRSEENRIATDARHAQPDGSNRWVALIATDIDGDPGLFEANRWRRLLPGWLVQPVPTASWVRPHLVERLLREGAAGIIIVRDGRGESAARAGNQWVEHRLEGIRNPQFRPHRAGHRRAHMVIDFNPAQPHAITAAASAFRNAPSIEQTSPNATPGIHRLGAIAVVSAILVAIAVTLSDIPLRNPQPDTPELLLTFKTITPEAEPATEPLTPDPSRPIHMQGRDTHRSRRDDLTVTMTVGDRSVQQTFRPKGLNRNGPVIGTMPAPLDPGANPVTIILNTGSGSPLEWSGVLHGQQRRTTVITFDDEHTFRIIEQPDQPER